MSGGCVLALAACTTSSSPRETAPSSQASPPCGGEKVETVDDERLTVATYDPVFAPWYVSNEPGNGQGFESALAFRMAKTMGFPPQRVHWVRIPFEGIVEPDASTFDLALAEVSVTAERKSTVDFSAPYATTKQVVVTTEDSPIAGKRGVNDLRKAKLGAAEQTTSLGAIERVIDPSTRAKSFPTIAAAAKALDERTLDGVVVDGPTAEYISRSQVEGGRLLGRLPGTTEQVAAVLPKGSTLTPCVNRAIAKLDRSGVIADLEKQWLSDPDGVRELSPTSPSDRTSPQSSSGTGGPGETPTEETGRTSPSPTK